MLIKWFQTISVKTSDQLLVSSALQNGLRWVRHQGVIMVHPEASRSWVALWLDLCGKLFPQMSKPDTCRACVWAGSTQPCETAKYTVGNRATWGSLQVATRWELRKNLFLLQTMLIRKKNQHNKLSSGILIPSLRLGRTPSLRVFYRNSPGPQA